MTDNINILDFSVNNNFIDNDEYIFTDKEKEKEKDNKVDKNNDTKENLIDFNIHHKQEKNQEKKQDKEPIKVKKYNNEKDTILTIDGEQEDLNHLNDTNASIDYNDKNINNPTSTSMLTLKKIGNRTFRTQIMTHYIRPRIEKDIENCFVWRDKWSKISNAFFSMSEIICIVQTIMAFTASSYDMKLLSFLAGMLGVLGISFNRFGTYARNASSEKTSQLNEVLGTIGIKDTVPDLMDNDYGENDKKKK
jgi:hypothetical protein